MKKFLFVLLFTSSAVFACPELTGNYTCTGDEYSYQMSIAQSLENDITTYSVTMEGEVSNYIADGVARPHTVTIEGEEIEGTLNTSCWDDGVAIQFQTNYNGADIDYTDMFSLLEDGSLKEEIKTVVNGELYSSENLSCARNN